MKICDFGLARDIMRDSNYISKGSVSTRSHASPFFPGLWAWHPLHAPPVIHVSIIVPRGGDRAGLPGDGVNSQPSCT